MTTYRRAQLLALSLIAEELHAEAEWLRANVQAHPRLREPLTVIGSYALLATEMLYEAVTK